MTTSHRHARNVDDDLWQRLRLLSIKFKKPMGELLNDAIEGYLEREEA